MTFECAYLLVSHGSRDPRHGLMLQEVAIAFKQALSSQPVLVKASSSSGGCGLEPVVQTAALELGLEPLHQEILKAIALAQRQGKTKLVIVPLFLSAGVHVHTDIPEEVALASSKIDFPITLSPFFGSYPNLNELLANKYEQLGGDGQILLAHGTTHSSGRAKLELRAMMLGASNAYTSMEPSLEQQVQTLIMAGKTRIAIVPYFLFPGRILDRVHQQIQNLQRQYPKVNILTSGVLATPEEIAFMMVGELGQ
ncbi:MAG: sirohydrochlorin chelatase [Synechococcaceae cyanobacterium RL_1_2]|nr:sirohydrochlorin chelatase [Synechococcaceae cyanobacterium RL_1_2]